MPLTSMEALNTELGPVDAMEWLTTAKRARIDVALSSEQGWGERLAELQTEFEPLLVGRFVVMLGNESLLQDDKAEYVIYFEAESDRDVILARYFLKV